MVISHISCSLELALDETKDKLKIAQNLHPRIVDAYRELEEKDPSNPYLRLVIFEDGFPKPRKSFERGYKRLIKKSPSFAYLAAYEKYLVDLESQIRLLTL